MIGDKLTWPVNWESVNRLFNMHTLYLALQSVTVVAVHVLLQMEIMSWKRIRQKGSTPLQRMIILGQNATTTKQSLSLTTSPQIMGSGDLIGKSSSFSICVGSSDLLSFMPLCVARQFQINMGRGAETQSGDLRGTWTIFQGPRLRRATGKRHCSESTFKQSPEWTAVNSWV